MELLTPENWNIFLLLALPGFISLKAYGLIHPVEDKSFKDSLLEAIAFGLMNAIVLGPVANAVNSLGTQGWLWLMAYLWLLVSLIGFPIVWAFLLNWLLTKIASKNWILSRHKTAWDHYFSEREPSWVNIHLKDGTQILGWFGEKSHASSFPSSGHLYVEKVWSEDENGDPLSIPGSRGMIFRPDDYKFVELFDPNPEEVDNG